jgi:hypothetical protein
MTYILKTINACVAFCILYWAGIDAYAQQKTTTYIDFSELSVIQPTSRGVLHHILDGLSPKDVNIDIELDCELNINFGRFVGCRSTAKGNPYALDAPTIAARRMVLSQRFDTAKLAQRFSGSVRVIVNAKLDFAQKVQLTRPSSNEIVKLEFEEMYTKESFTTASNPIRIDLHNPITVHILCQVQLDFSVACLPPFSEPEGTNLRNFDLYRLSKEIRVAPQYRDGSTSIGKWIELKEQMSPSIMVRPRS